MAGPGEWLATRRPARIALIAFLFPMPLLAVVSAALVAQAAITQGWRSASMECAAALVLLAAVTALAGGFWLEIGAGAAVTWLVAMMLGELRRAGSLALALQVAVLLGVAGAVAFTLWSRDPQAFWEQVLRDVAERAKSAGLEIGPADLLPGAARVMTGMMAASAVASSLAALFLGSWWADRRNFGAEFQELRMGRVMGILAAGLGVLVLTGLRPAVDDLLLVLATGFVVQGLAVIHWHGARREWPRAWPVALYLPLALLPALAALELALLALLGLADNGYGLRRTGGKVV
jgi:hypothetical protein